LSGLKLAEIDEKRAKFITRKRYNIDA